MPLKHGWSLRPLKAALLCYGLAPGSFSVFGWDRYSDSEAFQCDQALTEMLSPIFQPSYKDCGRAGDMPACPCPALKGSVAPLCIVKAAGAQVEKVLQKEWTDVGLLPTMFSLSGTQAVQHCLPSPG